VRSGLAHFTPNNVERITNTKQSFEIPVQITKLTFLGFYLNGAVDWGRYDRLGSAEVKVEIENGVTLNSSG
jgi:hypothetical protein